MISLETLTFSGSELNRAAELRSDPQQMAQHLAVGTVLPIWPVLHANV